MNRMNKTHPGDCIPTSSNCVKWDGGKLCCINVCPDDNISTVILKEAEMICHLVTLLDLSELEYNCLVDGLGEGETAPPKKLLNVLQFMVDYSCSLDTRITETEEGIVSLQDQIDQVNNPIFQLPEAYQYEDEELDLITQLPLDEVVPLILERTAESFETIEQLQTISDAHGVAITELESQIEPPTPIPEVTLPDIMGDSDPHPIDEVVIEFADQFSEIRDNLGTVADLVQAVLAQTGSLENLPALSVPGDMEDIIGWVSSPSNLSDSVKNLWITVLDMRAALIPLIPAPTTGCGSITMDFGVSMNGTNQILRIYLFGYATIPLAFENCDMAGSVVDIEDEAGNTFSTVIDLTAQAMNAGGFEIDLSGTPLNTKLNMEVTINSCLTNGVDTCNDTVTHTAENTISKCPATSVQSTAGILTVGVAPYINMATYQVSLYTSPGGTLVSTQTFVNPMGPVTAQWTSETPGNYEVRIKVLITDVPDTDCAPIPVTI